MRLFRRCLRRSGRSVRRHTRTAGTRNRAPHARQARPEVDQHFVADMQFKRRSDGAHFFLSGFPSEGSVFSLIGQLLGGVNARTLTYQFMLLPTIGVSAVLIRPP